MKPIRYLKKPNGRIYIHKEDEKRLRIAFISIVLIMLFLLIFLIPRTTPSASVIFHTGKHIMETQVSPGISKLGYQPVTAEESLRQRNVFIFTAPQYKAPEESARDLEKLLASYKIEIERTTTIEKGRGVTHFLKYHHQLIGSVTILKDLDYASLCWRNGVLQSKPKICIIIDDFGYTDQHAIPGFIHLNAPLSLAIIPGHRFSGWTAREAIKYNKEILVHMPMEPEDNAKSYGEEIYMLHNELAPFQIEERILNALRELPEASGMNNHMGSKATADTTVMTAVTRTLKKKSLYFIDSLTSPQSVGYEIARKTGIPAAVRTVFLDNIREKAQIQEQFEKAISVAELSGQAIIIGHVYEETLAFLTEIIKLGRLDGFTLVFASEIVS